MDFIGEEWLVPSEVETPNIEDDVQQYLGVEILEKWKASSDVDAKKTIVFIAERLDFVSHLNAFGEYAIKNSTKQPLSKDNGELWIIYNFEMDGHDFSGVQFDIEALVLYLLLTCVDAIQTQPKYYSSFEWLLKKVEEYEHQTKDQIFELLKKDQAEYDELYGLSRNFRLAFTDGISDALKTEFTENLLVAKFDNNGINKESFAAWKSKDVNQKIRKIANYLYHLRSKYTHNNIRSFMPQEPLGKRYLVGEFLLCKAGFSLEEMLKRVITELCSNKFQ